VQIRLKSLLYFIKLIISYCYTLSIILALGLKSNGGLGSCSLQRQVLLFTFRTMLLLVLSLLRYGVNNIACSFLDSFNRASNYIDHIQYCNISSNNPSRRFELTVVFESLCPDSQAFIIERLYPTILSQASMRNRIDIRLLPWGWAKRNASGITCQHGPGECRGNLLVSCLMAQDSMPIDERYRLFNCIETRLRDRRLEWIVINETVVDSQHDEFYRLMTVNVTTQASIQYVLLDTGVDRMNKNFVFYLFFN
jgi:hypothetical protein